MFSSNYTSINTKSCMGNQLINYLINSIASSDKCTFFIRIIEKTSVNLYESSFSCGWLFFIKEKFTFYCFSMCIPSVMLVNLQKVRFREVWESH